MDEVGACGFPVFEPCRISVDALRGAQSAVARCVLVAFDERTRRFWERALAA
ncbi:hypothetical protein [Kineosporia sp. NBRC 101731]|uniref:hypothetical protein n=1 Tax=Kineosporia sp. NBRC 101731 TaxID=3032199 RepID=UPI0024A1AED4|nr:hypothetical protein [Kineosporia sp. NBRC 101731]GLY28574.1 hypothetical protein Kisp02_19390 [Kineosporia sp. NBRC 101731]